MRGKAMNQINIKQHFRITPAYAGKSFTKSATALATEDHPRLCGEKGSPAIDVSTDKGSPPPMRGKGFKRIGCIGCPRITPAYAGKSKIFVINEVGGWDHPRLCGEKSTCDTA